jgi:hypothetical protein
MERGEARVIVDADGTAHPVGDTALLRMQARAGTFDALPSPEHWVVLRRVPGIPGEPPRTCLLAGEITRPGALCDVLSFVGQTTWRGELVVLEQQAARSVFLEDGFVLGGKSSLPAERLGQVLVRMGALTKAQTQQCADASSKGGIRFGEAAVRLGFVSREKLFAGVRRQIEETFFGTMLTSEGMFYLLEDYDPAELWAPQQLPVGALVREGVLRMHETRFFRTRVPSEEHVPTRIPGRAPPPPESDPLGVFGRMDGRRSVAEIGRLIGAGEFEVTRAVFQLVQSGHAFVKPPRLQAETVVSVYNRAIATILRELDAMDEGDAVREQLAAFAAQRDPYRHLFAGIMPADDGSLDPLRVVANLRRMSGVADPEEALGRWLYEYASYGLFLARPQLLRARQERGSEGAAPSDRPRLSQRVAQILEPIVPVDPSSAGRPTGRPTGRP